jgi:hypothetical protein
MNQEITTMTSPDAPEIAVVIRRMIQHGCEVTTIIADPADQQQTLYGTVTRDGALVGSFYCTDRIRQEGWRIVTATGEYLTVDGDPVAPVSEPAAIWVLTSILAGGDQHDIDRQLRDTIRPHGS